MAKNSAKKSAKNFILPEYKDDLLPTFWLIPEEQQIIKAIVIYDKMDKDYFVRRKEQVKTVLQMDDSQLDVYTKISLINYVDEIVLGGFVYLRYLKPFENFTDEEKEFFFGNPSEQEYYRHDRRKKRG